MKKSPKINKSWTSMYVYIYKKLGILWMHIYEINFMKFIIIEVIFSYNICYFQVKSSELYPT
jgi:hypothetical protein